MNIDSSLWPFVVYFFAALTVVAFLLGLSHVLGQRHNEPATGEPYESGIVSTGSARMRFNVKFYLTAVFFVIFDLEAAFLYAYAVAYEKSGWSGFVEMEIFVGVLLLALVYLWRQGALEWGTSRGQDRFVTPVDRKLETSNHRTSENGV